MQVDMWNEIWTWMGKNYPSIIVIVFVAALVWRVAKIYYTKIIKLEDSVNKLPCSTHEHTNKQVLEGLNAIKTYLITKDSKAASVFSQKASPRKLNTDGEDLLKRCGGNVFLKQHKDMLLKAIAERKPNTALDVENFANEILIAKLDSDIFNELKQWVYNSPSLKILIQGQEVEYAVTMNDICFVLSLPLRDMYLEQHKELQK